MATVMGIDLTSGGNVSGATLIANNGVIINSTTISANVTIAAGQNGFSVGPVTVASGYSVTVADGQRWVVI